MREYEMELIDYACKQVGIMILVVVIATNILEIVLKIINKKIK